MKVQHIGQSIKTQRKIQKLTQAEAAGLLNVGTRFLSDLENGKPTAQIGKALEVINGMGLQLVLVPKSKRQLLRTIEEALKDE